MHRPPTGNVLAPKMLPIIKMDRKTKPLPRSGIHLHLLCPASQENEARGERQKILAGPSTLLRKLPLFDRRRRTIPSYCGAPSSLEPCCRRWRRRGRSWGHLSRLLLRLKCLVVGLFGLCIRMLRTPAPWPPWPWHWQPPRPASAACAAPSTRSCSSCPALANLPSLAPSDRPGCLQMHRSPVPSVAVARLRHSQTSRKAPA